MIIVGSRKSKGEEASRVRKDKQYKDNYEINITRITRSRGTNQSVHKEHSRISNMIE